MYYGKVDLCGVNTAKLPLLSDREKKELLVKSKAGDTAARQRLIDGNLRLVLSIVQRYLSRCDSADDLFQVGCIGLIKAVDHFNTDLDVKFSTYAVPMIIGEVKRYLRDNNTIRVSRSMRDLAYHALSHRERLAKKLGREPELSEIAAALEEEGKKHSLGEISRALDAIVEPVSLYDPVFGDGSSEGMAVMDQISDPSGGEEVWLEKIALKEALKSLSEREQNILKMRFFRGKTQMEIASEIGISQAQVSRLEKGALERIRDQM